MRSRRPPFVLFAAAAGPEVGFGHLVRCGVLADALGSARQMILRGTRDTMHVALRRGWTIHRGARLIDLLQPDLVIVDEPRAETRDRWVREARAARVPAACILDGARGPVHADLVVDGSFAARAGDRTGHLAGPRYALIDAGIALLRRRHAARDRRKVLVALGGGAHVTRHGVAIARELVRRLPDVRVDLAAGFTTRADSIALPSRCRWIDAPAGLAAHLASAAVAVVAGGVSMYEACALGTPTVAVPVVEAQRRAIAAASAAGAVLAPNGAPEDSRAVALAVRHLLENPSEAARRARHSARTCDGQGLTRVAARLRALCDGHLHRGVSHAA